MEENTVFGNNNQVPPEPVIKENEGSSPVSKPGFPVKKVIKILLGVIVFFAVIFFVVQLISARNLGNKSEKVTLTYWGLWEDKPIVQSVISDFERQNPNVTIDYSKQDIKQYRERLITRINNGTGPDIFRFHNTWVMQISNILSPLPSDVIKNSDFQTSFYPVTQKDLVKNGAIYGIPLEIDTLSLFVNTDLFKAAGVSVPVTWDDFSKTSRILTVKDETGRIKTAGAAMGTFDNITHAPDLVSLLLIQNGADIRNLSSTSQNASDALSYYSSFSKGDVNVWDSSLDPSILAFAKGNLGMYFGYSWDVFTIKALSPSLNFQIISVPHLPNRNMTIASYWAEGVSSKSTHQKEAMLFMKYLSKTETEQKIFSEESKTRLFGEPYANKELAPSVRGNAFLYPFLLQAPNAVSSFFAGDTYDNGLNAQMNGYLGNAVRSLLDNTSPQSAVDTLSKGVSQILKQYGE